MLAFAPALALTVIANGVISRAIDRLQNPAMEGALTSSARLSQELLDRLRLEAEELLDELPGRPPDAAGEEAVRDLLRRNEFHFVAWATEEGASRVLSTAESANEGLPTPEEWATLDSRGAPAEQVGRAFRIFRKGDGAPGRAVGLWIEEDLAAAMRSATGDFGRYQQLRLSVEIQKRLVWFGSAAIFLLAATAAFVAAKLTARRISRPVTELARVTERIAGGDLGRRADVEAEGEIAELVASFNRMTEQLESSRDELLRMERIAAWRDVARRIAHEIRNPLTPIRLAVHRLQKRLPDDAAAQEALVSIGEEVEGLSRLAESFSDFAKLPESELGPADLAAVAKGVVELFRETAPGVSVEYEGPESLPLVADRDQLRRATTNLVKNATEALTEGGRIRVRVGSERGRGILEVSDDGPGIPAEIRDAITRPGVTAKAGGSGLGLAMVQRIAADHRGRLRWADRAPGTSFFLEIPLNLSEDS